jgi:hypothetical protein
VSAEDSTWCVEDDAAAGRVVTIELEKARGMRWLVLTR